MPAGRKKTVFGDMATFTIHLTYEELALVDAMKDQLKLPNRSYLGRLALAMHLSMLKSQGIFETPPELLEVDFFSSLRADIAKELQERSVAYLEATMELEQHEFDSAA